MMRLSRPLQPRLGLSRSGGPRHLMTHSVIVQASSKNVTISVKKHVSFGEDIAVVGDLSSLGSWDPSKGLKMKWSEGDMWRVEAQLSSDSPINFKLVQRKKDGDHKWEEGENRKLDLSNGTSELVCEWGEMNGEKNHHSSKKQQAMSSSASSSATSSRSFTSISSVDIDTDPNTSFDSSKSFKLGNSDWVGASPEFVTSRKDRVSRDVKWVTEHLKGSALELVKGDMSANSWLQKLGHLKDMLVDKSAQMRPSVDKLRHAYIYLTWVNNGTIACIESGGHHRPNRHAELAVDMFRSLEWVIGDACETPLHEGGDELSSVVLAARNMHKRLPSFAGEFRQSVPLTRIRDIAHRNDIPSQLKNEIKHTLQNKLHRNAGPEDLIAAEAMLARITAQPGQYNDSFVNEFRTFFDELRNFFNAPDLDKLLESTFPAIDDEHCSTAKLFISFKAQVERKADPEPEEVLALLHTCTELRAWYCARLQVPLRNDIKTEVLEMRQRFRLAEIRLEEFSFVLMSRIINVIESHGGWTALRNSPHAAWKLPIQLLGQGLMNVALSSRDGSEAFSVEEEVKAWYAMSPLLATKTTSLRFKSTLERVLRLSKDQSDTLVSLYSSPASDLGAALGVPDHMAHVFAEGEVRASIAFQVSKLASLLLKAARAASDIPEVDSIVTGTAYGRLVSVSEISPESVAKIPGSEDLILLVGSASGDEEMSALKRVRGVILRQDIPHLSHLGVRARQEGVPFATCEEPSYVKAKFEPLVGKTIKLDVRTDGVSVSEAKGGESVSKTSTNTSATASKSSIAHTKVAKAVVLPGSEAKAETCGSKAAKCAELAKLAASSTSSSHQFSAPKGVCLPFGVMDAVVESSGKLEEYGRILEELEDGGRSVEQLEEACGRMQALIRGLDVPQSLTDEIARGFDDKDMLVVRSSANVEDLAGMSAAGLYESVVGVKVNTSGAVASAVKDVWASLYARRAVLSRRSGGVGQKSASMGVLIQQLVVPDVSFVLHTARPSDGNTGILLAEMAPGQGETLASGTRGTPWRLEVDKASDAVKTLAFANFSKAYVLNAKTIRGELQIADDPVMISRPVVYSNYPMSCNDDTRNNIGRDVARVGTFIEKHYGGEAQDIEGGIVDGQVYIFQTRPQK